VTDYAADVPVKTVVGRRLNCSMGHKSRFVGLKDGSVTVSVEQLVLEHYSVCGSKSFYFVELTRALMHVARGGLERVALRRLLSAFPFCPADVECNICADKRRVSNPVSGTSKSGDSAIQLR
jgi:hypothetical protein